MRVLLDDNKFVSFQAIKMQPKDISASCSLLKQYQSLKYNEDAAMKLFAIFDKYIEQEAKLVSSEKKIEYRRYIWIFGTKVLPSNRKI